MALPNTISNGDVPDATLLMANFNWLAAGKGVASGTYADKGIPADYQLYYATDLKQLLFYTQDGTIGDNGWIVVGGG